MRPSDVSLMIFAAGFGTRMGELTKITPKPMLPLFGRPMIDHTLNLAKSAGIETVFANIHHLADKIEPHLAAKGVTVFRETPDILDTGGGLLAARPHLTSPTLTLNPDYTWNGPNPLERLLDAWSDEMRALLLVVPLDRAENRDAPGDFDLVEGALSRGGSWVYTGAQLIRTEDLNKLGKTVFSLNDYWDYISNRGPLHGLEYPGIWTDIGTADALNRANAKGPDDV